MQRDMTSLYITYDGLSDQLGGSQIIPYLKYLAAKGYKITVISCEKSEYLTEPIRKNIEADLSDAGINWVYVSYTKHPPILSSLYDLRKIKKLALKLFQDTQFDIIHCRSYLPALVGMALKKHFKRMPKAPPKFVFDMRGFWANEKIDVGHWKRSNPIYEAVYRYFKRAESRLIAASDHIVILTQAGADELMSWPEYQKLSVKPPITIIPCCVDAKHFDLVTPKMRREAKAALGFDKTTPVIGYLGGIGRWYMLDEMLIFFAAFKTHTPAAKMFFVTRHDPELILGRLAEFGLKAEDVLIKPAKRHEVPSFLASMDLGLSFILPAFSKIASSPTKQAEYLSSGIPIITNDKIGDNKRLISPIHGCSVLDDLERETVIRAAQDISLMPFKDDAAHLERSKEIRTAALNLFSLDMGGQRYNEIYQNLID